MSEFIHFVENESTQVRRYHDFLMDVKNNRTGPFADHEKVVLKDGEVFIKFQPGHTYTRSQVRRFFWEFYYKKGKMMLRMHKHAYDKSWLIAKGVKDYLILVGKLEFTYEEVEELIESQAALNYVQDMQRYMLFNWKEYHDNQECYYKSEEELKAMGKDCNPENIRQFDIFESFGAYPLMDV